MHDAPIETVILADGDFPVHPVPLALLQGARRVVCCDGAAVKLLDAGREPDWIVGDLDSLPEALRARFAARLAADPRQDVNDLTKAIRFCAARGWNDWAILGATGGREDHTLGNLALLVEHARGVAGAALVTDTGRFTPLYASGRMASRAGQQISVFSFDSATAITSRGLRYPLERLRLARWWQATLNEALGPAFELEFDGGPLLVYATHAAAGDPDAADAADLPVALTIAGSDSGGNAGIQADLRAFHALRVHGCTAIAALTAQNPDGVRGVQLADAAHLGQQLDAILDCYAVAALKTGMLATSGLIGVVAGRLAAHPGIHKVVDPVMVATSGARLLADEAVAALRTHLLPLATLITPNLPEAEVLSGARIDSAAAMQATARSLAARFGCGVLIKGGHDRERPAHDLLCLPGGACWWLATPIIERPRSTHGTGCTLSAAITAALAKGRSLLEAVVDGKAFVYEAIRTGRMVGSSAAVLGQPEHLPRSVVTVEAARNGAEETD
jgi:hydroxymethylpyrimidine/phosphomethylpyrimidine kinase